MPKRVPAKANEEAYRRLVKETPEPLIRAANDDMLVYFVHGLHPSYTAHAAHGRGVSEFPCMRRAQSHPPLSDRL